MATKNDITGDSLISKTNSEAYRNNYDLIFGKGKNNVKRTGCNDGTMGNGSGGNDQMEAEDAYPHDRVPSDCQH